MSSKKGLALLSGGLDSTLAVKAMVDQGLELEAMHFTTPFCNCDKCAVDRIGEELEIPVHYIHGGQDFLDLVADPPHGYGSHMNMCIDCRIFMFKKAKELGDEIGAEFYITGEVLGQRPFSQRRRAMELIESQAGLEGKILRPLSAKLLPATDIEESGTVDRDALYSIKGRRRTPQMELAEELGVYDYPCPAGGCLLTDPQFSKKLKEYLHHEGRLVLEDMVFLRLGRHFRLGGVKAVVGRDEGENGVLEAHALRRGLPWMEVSDYMGPITVLMGGVDESSLKLGAAITARYSDAPRDEVVAVELHGAAVRVLETASITDEELERYRV
ncbi:MAG: hypothetical protein PVJ38_09030 [Candidatus Bathyarchaeota archaeon]|jgi:hypothetical protein